MSIPLLLAYISKNLSNLLAFYLSNSRNISMNSSFFYQFFQQVFCDFITTGHRLRFYFKFSLSSIVFRSGTFSHAFHSVTLVHACISTFYHTCRGAIFCVVISFIGLVSIRILYLGAVDDVAPYKLLNVL